MNPQVWVMIRYALIALGSSLATKGYVEPGKWQTAVDALPGLFGTAMMIGSMVWGIYVRWGTRAVPKEVAASPTVPVVSPATGKTE